MVLPVEPALRLDTREGQFSSMWSTDVELVPRDGLTWEDQPGQLSLENYLDISGRLHQGGWSVPGL